MIQRICVAMLALILVFSFATLTVAQDKMTKEMKKDEKAEMSKSDKEMGMLKSVSCPSPCDFMVRSRDEKELKSMVKKHAKAAHKMTMTDAQVKEMMKMEEGPK